jgi:hypothetical protein
VIGMGSRDGRRGTRRSANGRRSSALSRRHSRPSEWVVGIDGVFPEGCAPACADTTDLCADL